LSPPVGPVRSSVSLRSPVEFPNHRAIDFLCEHPDGRPEEQLGAWLALGANDLVHLLANGWTVENILEALRPVLQVVQAMPMINRRQLFQLGAAAVVMTIPIPDGRHVSVDERMQLFHALNGSIGSSWNLLHTAGNAQVL